MPSIVTVTLNPTLDKTISVPRFLPGTVHRVRFLRQDLGGKGINVSRALQALGLASKIVAVLGGSIGQIFQTGLRAAGFELHFIEVAGQTRQNITLLDEANNQYTKLNEPGPTINQQHLLALEKQVKQMAQRGDLWAFCGSLPPGAPIDLYARLIQWVQERGGRAFLDTSGPAFQAGLSARPFAIKPNSEEAAEWWQRPLPDEKAHCLVARRLQAQGVTLVAVSRGAEGLVLATDGAVVMATPPPVVARSPVGAGDAALAGLLWAVSDGCDPVEMARRTVACGTAAAMQEGTALGDRALIEKLLGQVRVFRKEQK